MSKKKIIIQCLIAIFCMFPCTQIYSQGIMMNKLIWEEKNECVNKLYNYMKDSKDSNYNKMVDSNFVVKDSIAIELNFKNKEQSIKWLDGRYASIESEEFTIKENNIFVITNDVCSGINCPWIYIFKKRTMFGLLSLMVE